jgi:UDPglucose 6-dehydrogenase
VAGEEALSALEDDFAGNTRPLERLSLASNEMQALEGADALLVLTEWKHFHNPDFSAMKALMRTAYILDGRNLYNPQALTDWGIAYQGVGRRNHLALSVDFAAPVFANTDDLTAIH